MNPLQQQFESRPVVKAIREDVDFARVLRILKAAPDDEITKLCPATAGSLLHHIVQRKNDAEALQLMRHVVEERRVLDPKGVDRNRQNALFYAARDGNLQCVNYLISRGADLNHVDTALQTALFYACRDGRNPVVSTLLEHGCEINTTDQLGQTALFYACRDGRVSTVELMLQKGADCTITDTHKKLASHYAGKSGHKEIVQMLKHSTSSIIKPAAAAPLGNRKRYRLQCQAPWEEPFWIFAPRSKVEEFEKLFPSIAVWDPTTHASILPSQDIFRHSWQKAALAIVQEVTGYEGGKNFAKPVDSKAWGCHDYYQVIDKPMDFLTIKKKLRSHQYRRVHDFLSDVDLIFSNCRKYNQAETDIAKVGRSVESYYRNLRLKKGFDIWVRRQEQLDETYPSWGCDDAEADLPEEGGVRKRPKTEATASTTSPQATDLKSQALGVEETVAGGERAASGELSAAESAEDGNESELFSGSSDEGEK